METKSGYYVVKEYEIVELEKEVAALMSQGWECQGGMSVAVFSEDNFVFYQAMVKPDTYSVLRVDPPASDSSWGKLPTN